MPEVSIILPTYNRADSLPRAIASVVEQRFRDWELIVVDDGSTDNTAAVVEGVDPRVRYVRQTNGGCYAARNTGLKASSGRLITFLDSDDEWLPHYLELTVGFLRASPADQFVMTEFWVDLGSRVRAREDHGLVSRHWPAMAQSIGSHGLDLQPNETDDYLRVYETREPIGDWGREAAVRAGVPQAHVYHGHIFRHFRWGHLGWLPTTMVTRQALERVGPFLANYRTAADYRFIALLSRNYRANMIAVPCAIKHHSGKDGDTLAEDHLAVGPNEYRYAAHRLPLFDELFRDPAQPDPEIERIRGLYQLYAGKTALELGKRAEAITHLREAHRALPTHSRTWLLLLFVRLIPSAKLASALYRWPANFRRLLAAVVRGDMSIGTLLKKIWRRLYSTVVPVRAR